MSTPWNVATPPAHTHAASDITSGTLDAARMPALTGAITTSAGSVATTLTAKAVTLAKMDDMATASLIYRKTAGTGAPEVNTLATLKTDLGLTGTNTGDQTLPTRASLGVDTTDSPQFAGLNIGHASDTTITRVSAGVIAVEGVSVSLDGHAHSTYMTHPQAMARGFWGGAF